jgi:predicted Zn-dependent protease
VSKAIDQQLQSAFSLHQAGQLDKAASVYRQIIKSDPDNSYALQYLGVIEAGLGHFDQAKSLMSAQSWSTLQTFNSSKTARRSWFKWAITILPCK